jgi:hypothetical protein
MCKNLVYVLYILRRENGVGGREFGWFTLLRKWNYCCCQVTVWLWRHDWLQLVRRIHIRI